MFPFGPWRDLMDEVNLQICASHVDTTATHLCLIRPLILASVVCSYSVKGLNVLVMFL